MLHPTHIHQLEHQHELVVQIFRRTSPASWKAQPEPGKWSMHDQLAHLARYQQVFLGRMQEILDHDGVSFQRYVAENDPQFAVTQNESTENLLELLLKTRAEIVSRAHSLSAEESGRKGIHPVFGPMDITTWIEFFLVHEGHHLFSVFKLSRTA
ncbi:MAG: hypothetical protein FD123_1844 [Bacteroidetes bacterium]|nr:MAG: hypothetical protein FD123_1844 [Bacteroidota bacterium]